MYLNEGIIYTHTAASRLFLFEAFQKLGFPRVSHMIPTTKEKTYWARVIAGGCLDIAVALPSPMKAVGT